MRCERARTGELEYEHVDHMVAIPDLGITSLDAGHDEWDAEEHFHAGEGAIALTVGM